jgi:sugar phosphate isomerase/epimerase
MAATNRFSLCIHQTTSAGSGYRRSLEGYARAGIRHVEVIPPMVDEFVRAQGMPAARRVLADLGMKAVSSGGVRGIWEPHPGRAAALEDLKRRAEITAELGVDRMVCPCGATAKYSLDDYHRAIDSAHEAGEIVRPYGVVAMIEFMRGSTFIGTLPTALRIAREAAHPFVKPMFDCYHFQAGLSKFEDIGGIHEGEIHHVHFQDVPDIPRELLDNTTREIPGTGVSPLRQMLHALSERGYAGPLSVELFYPKFQQGDPYEVAMQIRRSAERLLI